MPQTSDVADAMSEIETESQLTRAEVASYLRDLAAQLDEDAPVDLELGGQTMTLDPVDPVTLKLEGETNPPDAGQAKQSIEVELVWWTESDGETAEELASESTADTAGESSDD